MPSSYPQSILPILEAIEFIKPKSVLDIGFGRGKYGFLVKEYYPKVKVDGLEVFEPYITNLQREIYDNIFIGDILKTEVGQYDLYLLIDIIEHFEKEEAHDLLNKLLKQGKIIVSTPKTFIPQEAENGNEWEIHKTLWTIDDFKIYNHRVVENEFSLILILYANLD